MEVILPSLNWNPMCPVESLWRVRVLSKGRSLTAIVMLFTAAFFSKSCTLSEDNLAIGVLAENNLPHPMGDLCFCEASSEARYGGNQAGPRHSGNAAALHNSRQVFRHICPDLGLGQLQAHVLG